MKHAPLYITISIKTLSATLIERKCKQEILVAEQELLFIQNEILPWRLYAWKLYIIYSIDGLRVTFFCLHRPARPLETTGKKYMHLAEDM